ncbi:hypothetical protein [Streptomyces lydicus]|uniref:hypothetical protein n=1 Tax=Streptomyces lydicus TaxID=47763 RepID=UPI0037933C04
MRPQLRHSNQVVEYGQLMRSAGFVRTEEVTEEVKDAYNAGEPADDWDTYRLLPPCHCTRRTPLASTEKVQATLMRPDAGQALGSVLSIIGRAR